MRLTGEIPGGFEGASRPAETGEAGRPAAVASRETRLAVPLYALLAAEALLFGLAAPSGKIPEAVLTLFRALLAL